MFSSNFNNDDECKLKQLLLEFIVVVGLLLMASPLLAFADDASKITKESPHTQVTASVVNAPDGRIHSSQGEIFPWEEVTTGRKSHSLIIT